MGGLVTLASWDRSMRECVTIFTYSIHPLVSEWKEEKETGLGFLLTLNQTGYYLSIYLPTFNYFFLYLLEIFPWHLRTYHKHIGIRISVQPFMGSYLTMTYKWICILLIQYTGLELGKSPYIIFHNGLIIIMQTKKPCDYAFTIALTI